MPNADYAGDITASWEYNRFWYSLLDIRPIGKKIEPLKIETVKPTYDYHDGTRFTTISEKDMMHQELARLNYIKIYKSFIDKATVGDPPRMAPAEKSIGARHMESF